MDNKSLRESIMPWAKRHEILAILCFGCAAGLCCIDRPIAMIFAILIGFVGCCHVSVIVNALGKAIDTMDDIKRDMEFEMRMAELEKGKK